MADGKVVKQINMRVRARIVRVAAEAELMAVDKVKEEVIEEAMRTEGEEEISSKDSSKKETMIRAKSIRAIGMKKRGRMKLKSSLGNPNITTTIKDREKRKLSSLGMNKPKNRSFSRALETEVGAVEIEVHLEEGITTNLDDSEEEKENEISN
jgi:hypothetical protein